MTSIEPFIYIQHYKRRRINYYSKVTQIGPEPGTTRSVERKLSFVAYHLIKKIHGEDALKQMASEIPDYWPKK